MIKSRILLKKITFESIKIFCENWESHSKRERMEIIDLTVFFLLDDII